jgi:catechol 2,3-dioxygenase-like lactoylglutathione lyase family enzyme
MRSCRSRAVEAGLLAQLERHNQQVGEIEMLSDKNAVANLAVKDLERAGKFYRDTLGLAQVGAEGDEVIVLESGNTTINVYRSQYAGTNKATAVTWTVGDDVEGVVRALKAKGVTFEHYDMPGMRRDGDIHLADNLKVAWFKDPDGNILNIVNR